MSPAAWALLAGNFAIGCGVFVVPGALNDLVRSLGVSVAVGGQLITAAAAAMALGAPLLAAAVGGWDRRRLLTLTLLWYGAGHLACAAMPGYAALLPARALTVLGAAVFTPQAAAAIGHMSAPQERGRAITFVFLGWSVASVLGMPLNAYVGETFGWRAAFTLVGLIALACAAWIWRTLPSGVRPAALSLASWQSIFTRPALLAIPFVTALSGAGQFVLFSYLAPYVRQQLQATPAQTSLLFMWFGVFGLIGNVAVSRLIDRTGADRAVTAALASMGVSMLLWPLADSVALAAAVLVPWALGCFSSNSAQQARAGIAAPTLAPGLLALNTSAIYVGQAIGAAAGGALIAAAGFPALAPAGLVGMVAAILLSAWIGRAQQRLRDG